MTAMALDTDRMYRAMVSRDRRFEGHFVIGVRTTGIYCRPGCPARMPRRENVRFYPCTAAAQAAGLRPCLRCRPDAAPGTPAALGTPATVTRALRLIAQGALEGAGVDPLAERLGVTARHLRRLFDRHLGASPLEVAHTQRVHFARKLLEETALPMTEVAHAAGFASVRRFNEAMRDALDATPTELRTRGRAKAAPPRSREGGDAIVLRLPYREPLAFEELLAFLAARAIPGVERVEHGTYVRVVSSGVAEEGPGTIAVSRAPAGAHLLVAIRGVGGADLFALVARVRALFDLDADPARIDAHLAGDRVIGVAVRARPGLRVPGAWDPFEIAVRAILGQQVSVRAASTLAGRLVARFGRVVAGGAEGLTHLFPEPLALVDADIASIGMPRARAEAIRGLARAVAEGEGVIEDPHRFASLPGIGAWTAGYVAMRALRDPDAFPRGDVVLRRFERASDPWRPWRAYAAMHLWTMEARR
jgi:AraC family transcriptional regulator, regulatory protein of adaptative response / DNA-3-methyladenine glycosylase II